MMRIKKQFSRILGLCLVIGSLVNVCSGQIYRENVSVLAVENRYALVQLGFDVSDALNMDYVVFDSTSSNFDNNIVYVWNDSINDWVKSTIPAFLDGSLFYNKNVKDVMVITDSLNAIQKFGENATWALQMFVIDQLNFPDILNSINDKYDFTAAQWNVFSTKYNVTVENVATNKSRYTQPLWDFSLPAFTVEARENSANANLTAKDIQESSVEVVIVDTEFLETSTVETNVGDKVTQVEEREVVVEVVEVAPVAEDNAAPVVEDTSEVVEESVGVSTNESVSVEEPVVDSAATNASVVVEDVQKVVETKTVEITVVEEDVAVVSETNAPAVPQTVSSQIVKPGAPVVVVEEAEEVVVPQMVVETNAVEEVNKVISEAPEVDSNINQVELEL
jgi:hypothetical protein